MRDWTPERVRTTVYRLSMAAPVNRSDMYRLMAIAEDKYRKAHGMTDGMSIPDDVIVVTPEDDWIVVSFTEEIEKL